MPLGLEGPHHRCGAGYDLAAAQTQYNVRSMSRTHGKGAGKNRSIYITMQPGQCYGQRSHLDQD